MHNTSKLTLPPLSLYIHFPWCIKKCPYCDFNSHEFKDLPEQQYISTLLKDLNNDITLGQGRSITSIFMGGGTPSLFSAPSIGLLLENIASKLSFSSDIEITIEANPATAEIKKFKGFRDVGINRLSIGVQSFNDVMLKNLQRVHSAQDAISAYHQARSAGFDNINIDLMHGISQQTLQTAIGDLETVTVLQPEHISWYQLTIEPNTTFYSQKPLLPREEHIAAMQNEGIALLQNKGYQRYEISAYSQVNRESKHNLNYWTFGDYLGIGAGAHSKITDLENHNIIRINKFRQPNSYLSQRETYIAKRSIIPPNELPAEFMMNALRLKEGVKAELFSQRTGIELTTLTDTLSHLENMTLLSNHNNKLKASAKGYDFLDNILTYF